MTETEGVTASQLKANMMISLDGYTAGREQSEENPVSRTFAPAFLRERS